MRSALGVRELRRSADWPLAVVTVVLFGLLLFIASLPGPLPFAQGPDALVLVQGRGAANALSYGYVLEILLAAVAALPILVLSGDITERSRGLILTYPVDTVSLVGARLAVAMSWSLFWTLGALVGAAIIGLTLPWLRDLALLLPEEAFVLAGVFATTEWTREPGFGTGFAVLAIIFGYGIRGLPFAQPIAMNLELIDAHNHALSQSLWLNRLVLLGAAVALCAVGTAGVWFHRRRGSYAGS